jgi:hypothetical protein
MFRNLSLQTEIFPCKGKYNAKELAALDKSWARVIKDKLLPVLAATENKFAQFFDATFTPPKRPGSRQGTPRSRPRQHCAP